MTAAPQPTLKSLLGKTLTGTIESMTHDGRGVTRVEGYTVFVDGALPGETVQFRPFRKRRHFGEAVTEAVLSPSPDRVTPRCPHFGVCGGCSLQHQAPEAQIAAKEATLFDNLQRLGHVRPAEPPLPPLTGVRWGYRRKARLGVKYVEKKGGTLIGFRERQGRLLAQLTRCDVLHPAVGERLTDLAALIDGLRARRAIPQIEVAAGDAEVALVFRHLEPLEADDRAALRAFGERHGLQILLQPKGPDTIVDLDGNPPADLHTELPAHDVTLTFQPTDFLQVNADVNRRMIDAVLAELALAPEDRVLDLFCGLGNFSLPMARQAAEVVGVEGEAAMVARAERNAALNGITNARFLAADLAASDAPPWGPEAFDKVLLDPPRTGALAVLPHVAATGAARVVYVSCNPATLARDAEVLVRDHGYTLRRAGVMDMFPHTAHVESLAVFER